MKNSENNSDINDDFVLLTYIGETKPENPRAGQLYFDKHLNAMQIFDGEKFIFFETGSVIDFYSLYDRAVKCAFFPEIPEEHSHRYLLKTLFNTSNRKLYIFDGSNWVHVPHDSTVEDIEKVSNKAIQDFNASRNFFAK